MPAPQTGYDFLCVDRFIRTLIDARSLKTAFDLQLIDLLAERKSSTLARLLEFLPVDAAGLQILLDLLAANEVVVREQGQVRMSDQFSSALRYRDLLEAKLDFANLVAPDFLELFTELVARPGEFFRRARLFELFDYQRCWESTAQNLAATARWMRFTTMLTKYEAEACFGNHDFSQYKNLLDIGGNSGEFALRACQRHAELRATVVDLPVVCEIGQQHVSGQPAAAGIRFQPADALHDPLPAGSDIVTFKSILHDWPDDDAGQLINRAAECLDQGGTLLIFERGPIDCRAKELAYGSLPMLLFFRSFRSAKFYEQLLEAAGLDQIETRSILLEMPFMLVTARKRRS